MEQGFHKGLGLDGGGLPEVLEHPEEGIIHVHVGRDSIRSEIEPIEPVEYGVLFRGQRYAVLMEYELEAESHEGEKAVNYFVVPFSDFLER